MPTSSVVGPQSAGSAGSRSADPDNPVWSDEELLGARRARELRRLRLSLDLTREEFAERHGLAVDLVAAWEKNREALDGKTLQRLLDEEADIDGASSRKVAKPKF